MSKTFGEYVAGDLVTRTPNGAVYLARHFVGSAGVFAIKEARFPLADPDEPRWDCQRFLDRARVQRSLVAAGARYWAPIYDMGLTDDGAWVATDHFPLTAQKLIESHVELDDLTLSHLIDSVVRGLVELQQVRRRPHGGLTPGNVMIASDGGELADAQVLLTDPALETSQGEAGDLNALGNLIHQLVLHRPFTAASHWPLPDAAEWQRLGDAGDGWRELCSALLAPDAAARPALFEVAHLVRTLAPQRRRFQLHKRYLLIPAAAACLALFMLGWLAYDVVGARREFAAARHGWVDAFATALADPQRRARYQQDPDLANVIEEMDRSRLASVPVDGPWFSVAELHRLHDEIATVHRVEQDLVPQNWARLGELVALEQKYQWRKWEQPADQLASVIAGAQPRPGEPLAAGIDRALQTSAILARQQAVAEEQWQQLLGNLRIIESRKEPTLTAMAGTLRTSGAAAVRLTDGGYAGLDQLDAAAGRAGRLADAARAGYPAGYDVQRLAMDLSGAGADLSRPNAKDIDAWLAQLPLYAMRGDDAMTAVATLKRRLAETAESVARLTFDVAARNKLEQDWREIASHIEQFARTPFVRKDFEAGTFAARREAIESEMAALQRYAQPRTPAEWLQSLPAMATTSPRINTFWADWKKARLDAPPTAATNQAELATLKVHAEALQSGLADLDRRFPAAPADLSERFRAVAQRHREAEIGKLLGGVDRAAPRLDTARAANAAAAYTDWCNSLRDLARAFPLRQPFLSADDHPDEQWTIRDGLWNDPDVRELLSQDLRRLSNLRALATAPRDVLITTARESDSAELAFEAWRRLGMDNANPWPVTATELATEGELRRRVSDLIGALHDASDRTAPTALLRQEGPLRWRRVVEHAANEPTLAAAWAARGTFNVSDQQLAELPATARYNLWLWQSRQAVARGDDAAASNAAEGLRRAAGDLKDHPAAGALLAALDRAGRAGAFADRKPGDWFKMSLAGAPAAAVEFKRVVPKEGRPFYLATTAVSLGQFVAAVDAASAWDECRRLPWAYRPGEPDPRRGPRVWEWTPGPSPRLAPPQLWLAGEQDNDFPLPLRAERFNRMALSDAAGGSPSEQHPMQQVSAEAALWFAGLCGCRLPTAAEWQAAYEQDERKGSLDGWNLRDRTWDMQRAYVWANRQVRGAVQWPDEGIFRCEAYPALTGEEARSRLSNDGALYFRPVGASGGAVFHHLVGNVAQYVCDAPAAFEAMAPADRKSAEAVARFARQSGRDLAVIGGSALSPPELPIDKPLPLDRPDKAFADVGFRLAFTAPPRSPSESLRYALAGQPYLWAAAAEGAADSGSPGTHPGAH